YPTDDWTWDDFLRVAKQVTRDTDGDGSIDQWGSAFDGRLAVWLPWIWAGGGDVLCADGRRASGCLDSRATIEALRWYAGWAPARAVAEADTLGWDAAFLRAAAHGRPSWGGRVGPWRDVAERLADLMDRIVTTGVDPARAAGATARELDRLLGATR